MGVQCAAVLQAARLQALEAFRTGESLLLLATDVAARGLDILGVQAVVNYNCPRTLDTYLHRVGRTARAGAQGLAISLVEDMDRQLIKAVMKHACKTLAKRDVPKGVVHAWRAKVEALTSSVEDVLMVRPCNANESRSIWHCVLWHCVMSLSLHTPSLVLGAFTLQEVSVLGSELLPMFVDAWFADAPGSAFHCN